MKRIAYSKFVLNNINPHTKEDNTSLLFFFLKLSEVFIILELCAIYMTMLGGIRVNCDT